MAFYIKDLECLDTECMNTHHAVDYPICYALVCIYRCYLVKLAKRCLEDLKPRANQLCHQRLQKLDISCRLCGIRNSG